VRTRINQRKLVSERFQGLSRRERPSSIAMASCLERVYRSLTSSDARSISSPLAPSGTDTAPATWKYSHLTRNCESVDAVCKADGTTYHKTN
jgi:hypothetical protein